MKTTLRMALAGAALFAAPVAWAAPITYGYTGSLQSFAVTQAGNYAITAFGAQGAQNRLGLGGSGAEAAGTFSLSVNQVLSVLVGGAGTINSGGGGSFVFFGSGASATPLVVAGGGGSGQTTTSGGGGGGGAGAGGMAGAGGSGAVESFMAGGGGGGFFGAGSTGSVSLTGFTGGGGGQAATAGGAGGANGSAGSSGGGAGGYGGGGGGGAGGVDSGGGGGGYSGGGGGGSFLALGAINTTLLAGVQGSNGLVTIEYLAPVVAPPTAVPEPASLAILGIGVAGLLGWRRRQGV